MPRRRRSSSRPDDPSKESLPRAKEVTIAVLGIEIGCERFNNKDAETPSWSHARANLTALSHAYNLYFVAYEDQVWVFQPSFPVQQLGHSPGMVIKPPPTGFNRLGYFNSRRPDDINHLTTAFLGNDEILVFCSDCGDVWFYYISRIWNRISLDNDTDCRGWPVPVNLRPDMAESVGMSAWGLSVHTHSRKIAISSNTHRVTIVHLGLSSPINVTSIVVHEDESIIRPTNTSQSIDVTHVANLNGSRRPANYHVVLPEVSHENMPCVSFCNTDDDPEGKYLAVGDIRGSVMRWDIEKPGLERSTAHFCVASPYGQECRCLRDSRCNHAIWGLHWLDKRQFRKYGCTPEYLDSERDSNIIRHDIGKAPSSSTTFRVTNPHAVQYRQRLGSRTVTNEESDAYSSDDSTDSDSSSHSAHLLENFGAFVYVTADKGDPVFPQSPFLSISSKQIALHQGRGSNKPSGLVVMNHPLRQIIPAACRKFFHKSWWQRNHTKIQRMSLHASIPELGVIIVASPYGRCALISLFQGARDSGLPFYYYRIDWMLPTREQEERGDRPGFALMGLAVGPIQGQLGAGDYTVARRWRLMLTYYNHSVLSYEISRERHAIPSLEIC